MNSWGKSGLWLGVAAIIMVVMYNLLNTTGVQPKKAVRQHSDKPTRSLWQTYTSGTKIERAFSLTIPPGWTAKFRNEGPLGRNEAAYRIALDFAPPSWQTPDGSANWMGWGGMDVDVYPFRPDVTQWINDFLPDHKDGLLSQRTQIGGNVAYYLIPDPERETLWSIGWAPRYLVLGRQHSYVIGFFQNGEPESHTIMTKEILPTAKFN